MNVFNAVLNGKKPNVKRNEFQVGLGSSLVIPAGGEDLEFQSSGLQHALCKMCDEEKLSVFVGRLESQEKWPDVRRVCELSDPSVSHDWMWALNLEHGRIVPPNGIGDALRI